MGVWTPPTDGRVAVWYPATSRLRAAFLVGPRGLLLRLALMLAVAVAVSRLHSVRDPGVLCPLRALTGIPCPLCGSTTAFIELGAGDVAGAIAAQPVTTAATAVAIVAPMAVLARWRRLPHRWGIAVFALTATGSWLYQLHRFGWLG
jgi:hypothetical protein